MAITDPTRAPGSARGATESEPTYEGPVGRTRVRSVHVPAGDLTRTLEVHDVVNVATDPGLREAALSGALHRFEGAALAIPFVYHDPSAQKLALVVPEALAHEELRLRADLLLELSRDTSSELPRYAREATTVVGTSALRLYLERPNTLSDRKIAQREEALGQHERSVAQREGSFEQREKALAQHENAVAQREAAFMQRERALEQRAREIEAHGEAVSQRETRLLSRAEDVTRREDELRTYEERMEATLADLTLREREVESRSTLLRQREAELLSSRARPLRVRDDEVQVVEELEPLATSPGDVSDLAAEVVLVDEGQRAETIRPDSMDVELQPLAPRLGAPGEEALVVVDDDVEVLDEVEPTGEILPGVLTEASVPPPAGFLEGKAPMTVMPDAGTVRLFVRVPEGKDDLFASPELLVQLALIESYPVVLLTLAENDGESVVRAALDPRRSEHRTILENLRRHFSVRAAIFSVSGRCVRTMEVSAPREVNVARILERIARIGGRPGVEPGIAVERALASPPPVRALEHPFVEPEPALSAKHAADALERLAEWSIPDKLEHALLVLSIPPDRIDATTRRVIEDAVEHGLALSDRMIDRALALGLARDAGELFARQIAAFRQTAKKDDRGGLSSERVAETWERLLALAADAELTVEAETQDLAKAAIRKVRGEADIDVSKLPEVGVPQLVVLLEDPRYRRAAALELCRRGDPALADTLCKSIRKMRRAEVVRVVPRIVELGDEAGDALIDGLTARKTFARQAFALALGHLKLRRAVVPLVHLLASEQSEIWQELARIVGSFGNASLRNVSRQLANPKGKADRYAWTLAHLANHGCGKMVERLAGDERQTVADLAAEALTLREQAQSIDDQVRGVVSLRTEDPILKFSRRFYEELGGKAPEHDLEEPAGPET